MFYIFFLSYNVNKKKKKYEIKKLNYDKSFRGRRKYLLKVD
jgi:hypothetical protein